MPLSTILEYQVFPMPETLDATHLKNIPLLEQEIEKQVTQFSGEAIILPNKNLPAWFYLLIFKHLYPVVPEIVLEVEQGFYLVLATTYQKDDAISRPESVHVFSNLFLNSASSSEKKEKEIRFDLDTFPLVELSNLKTVIAFIKTHLQDADTILLTGKADPVTSLICYVLWRQCARNVVYVFESKRIALS